jgi:hypothetical protein
MGISEGGKVQGSQKKINEDERLSSALDRPAMYKRVGGGDGGGGGKMVDFDEGLVKMEADGLRQWRSTRWRWSQASHWPVARWSVQRIGAAALQPLGEGPHHAPLTLHSTAFKSLFVRSAGMEPPAWMTHDCASAAAAEKAILCIFIAGSL